MATFTRSELFKMAGASFVGASAIGVSMPRAASAAAGGGEYTLPPLPYAADALEPHIDAKTLTIHHDKHHAGYVRGLNGTLAKLADAQKAGDFAQIQSLCRALGFHGSGHLLHTLYFGGLSPKSKPPSGALLRAINKDFGSVDTLQAQLAAASKTVAGSGWGALAYEPLGKRLIVLQIEKHENQVFCGTMPLLVIDVWEHAYYVKYQNLRGDYVTAVMNIINWDEIAQRYDAAVKA